MSHLRVVKNQVPDTTRFRLLVLGPPVTQAEVEEADDVECPLVSLLLAPFYRTDGVIQTGRRYGLQGAVLLTVSRHGVRRTIRGAAVPLMSGPDILLPRGFFLSNHVG